MIWKIALFKYRLIILISTLIYLSVPNLPFSYCAVLFRQLHSFLEKTHKSSLRILTGGHIIINLIINIGDTMAFLTVSVNIDMFLKK